MSRRLPGEVSMQEGKEEISMKVLLINGSPNEKGCTYTGLSEVAGALEGCGIETEIFHVGRKAVGGCLGCKACLKLGKCVQNDVVNAALEKLDEADGLVIGSPVHYAAASGMVTSFLDRLFYAGGKAKLQYKPGCVIVSCRRGGASAAFDQLNKYFTISNMPIVSSSYWNMIHGNTPEEVLQDEEGLQTMRNLGRNMAWLLSSIQAGKEKGICIPEAEAPLRTNFIR